MSARPFKVKPIFVQDTEYPKNDFKKLAIIIPARNEEIHIDRFLSSCQKIKELGATIIVVDDQSNDETYQKAVKAGVFVTQTIQRPLGWSGKNWACHSGFEFLKKLDDQKRIEYILFTDADTSHYPEKLVEAMAFFIRQRAQLMTTIPSHLNLTWWEKVLETFHLYIYCITDANNSIPSEKRFFSIGQFLLFEYDFYEKIGGHSHLDVRSQLAEDLSLSLNCFRNNGKFLVYPQRGVYSVRMYSTFVEFSRGWERNLRLGMSKSSWMTAFESCILIGGMIQGMFHWKFYLVTVALIILLEKRNRYFAIFYPISLSLFVFLSLKAAAMNLLSMPIAWKNRLYNNL